MAKESEIRVLHIITVPLSISGLPLFALRIGAAMKGVRSDFLSYGDVDPRASAILSDAHQRAYIAPHRLRHPLRYARYVKRIVQENNYDIVHCHGNSATMALDLLAARSGGARIRIAHSHNTSTRYPLLHRLLDPLFQRACTSRMACGREAGTWLFGKRAFLVIPNGIHAQAFRYDPELARVVRKERSLSDTDRVIGWAGSFVEQKNLPFLLGCFRNAAAREPSLHLALLGDGPLREEICAAVRQYGLTDRVWIPGAQRDMSRSLQAMDLMVLPSLFEGFPTVALEWQCSGLPALLSDAITPDCVLTSFTSRLPLREEAWVEALLNAPKGDRTKNSEEGIRAVCAAGYDIGSSARALREEYARLMNKRGEKP